MDNTPKGKTITGKHFLLGSLLIAGLFWLNTCASIGPRPGFDTDDFPQASYGVEDINGISPDAVYIKTRSQTFNTYHYYILRDGLIWYKSIEADKEPKEWTLFEKTGLPHNNLKFGFKKPKKIVEISADADELVALSDEGGFYRYCFDGIIGRKGKAWLDRQGWPDEEQLYLDRRVAKNLSWVLGKRNAHVLYYEDTFGNQHHNGTMEIATTYVLLEDGQEICYADTGLPSDFSRNYIGPERGAFKAVSLSASASTMFVINEAGEMYTRLADFDTIGCDPMFFKYTYVPYQSNLPGDSYFSNLTEWGLPAEDWRPQPRIPLTGNAAITRHITILQNGRGNSARELRVAGLDERGETGYWSKAIFDDAWIFKPVPLYFNKDVVLETAVFTEDSPQAERGSSLDKQYGGYQWTGGEKEAGWEYAIPNFNILEGDCDFHISWRGETCTLKLYPVEMWTYLKRNYLPGRTGSPKMFLVTLEIPENAFAGLSTAFITQLTQKFARYDKELFQYTLAASNHYILLWDTGNTDNVVFLTDEVVSNQYTEFRQTWLVEDFEELKRYHSTELSVDHHLGITYRDLIRKIELNRAFRDELKYQIRSLKRSRLTALKINAYYLSAHYTIIMTPLRFIDVPKFRTITKFGDRLVLENSSYVYDISNIRIWAYEKILELLEVRLLCYNELAKDFLRTDSNNSDGTEISFPAWYSENISGYWNIAGLPRAIRGAFFSPRSRRKQIPAILSLIPAEKGSEFFGWYFSIGDSLPRVGSDGSFSIFIDPLKSPKTIYSRAGKTPEEETVQLDGVLYIKPGTNSPVERDIIDHIFKPLLNENNQGIKVEISFDGSILEIRECQEGRSNALLFRGEL